MNKDVARFVAKTILEHSLAVFLKKHSKSDLELINSDVDNNAPSFCGNIYIYVEFEKQICEPDPENYVGDNVRTSCELSIRENSLGIFKDEEGNVFARRGIDVGVNWPAYGATECKVALSRLEFMTEIAVLGQLLAKDLMTPTTELVMSAEQAKAQEAEQKELINRLLAETIVTAPDCKPGLKNIRVGNTRTATHDCCKKLPAGTWRIALTNGKTFDVTKPATDSSYVFVSRVAGNPL